jgi:pyridoxine 5-phosphate synthase
MTSSPHPRTALSVNVNKVALVRNTRHLGIPSVTRAALLCLQAGAQGITVHPGPMSATSGPTTCTSWPSCSGLARREYNIEGNPRRT